MSEMAFFFIFSSYFILFLDIYFSMSSNTIFDNTYSAKLSQTGPIICEFDDVISSVV